MILKLVTRYGFLTYLSLIIIFQVAGLFEFYQLQIAHENGYKNNPRLLSQDWHFRDDKDNYKMKKLYLDSYAQQFEYVYIFLTAVFSFVYVFISKNWLTFLGKSVLTSGLVLSIGIYALGNFKTYTCNDLCGLQFVLIYPPFFLFAILGASFLFHSELKRKKEQVNKK